MSLPRFVLCLVLSASSLGFAQVPGDEPLPPPPLVPAPTSPAPLVPAPEQPEEPPRAAPEGEIIPRTESPLRPTSPRFAGSRVAVEALGGIAGGLGLGLGTALAIGGLFSVNGECVGEEACGVLIGVLALPAVAIGIPLGVYIAGGLMEGKGRFLPTLGGMGLGLLAATVMVATESDALVVLGLVAFPIAGAIVGYELSHPERPRLRDGYASNTLQVTPLLGVTHHGSFVGGLSGRF
ncbi:hypothetical protein [Hyalangium versicolor]|uniref:hypothetical protein n=1 Tax=Hyalangium versicolor TaxID=2861190 RepID=UPI001CCFAAC1|nr:hypothetical protein [Hyalangium versicolor]